MIQPAERRVAIIGLGLMGGSLARALSSRGVRILGYDRSRADLDLAVRAGVVDEPLGGELAGVESAETVVLALPVDATGACLQLLQPRLRDVRLVMDLASTKRSIVACAESAGIGARFVGAHPLVGSHRSGWGASRASLFEGARVFLCPAPSTTPDAVQLAKSFWNGLSADTELLDAGAHDDAMAWRSHLPQFVSSALAGVLRDAMIPRSELGAGGRDMTRLAGSSTAMWTAIAADNAPAIVGAVSAFEDRLHALRDAIARGDSIAITGILDDARDWFDGEPTRPLTPGGVRA